MGDSAAESFQAALAVDPRMVDAHTHLGQLLRDRGEFGSAVESFRMALAIDSDQAAVHCDLGMALRLKGDLDAAIKAFEAALDLLPGDPEMRRTYEELLRERRERERKDKGRMVVDSKGKACNGFDYSRFDSINSDSD